MNEARQLTEADLDAFFNVRSVSYPGSGLEADEMKGILKTRLPFTSGLFVGGELSCVATMWPLNMYLHGKVVKMGGLGGVASAPEFRRRGLVRELLHASLRRLRDEGTGWSLESPFDPVFYQRLGWQSVPSGNELEFPNRRLLKGRPPTSARRLPLSEFASLAPIYQQWASRYTFTLTRTDDPRESWTRITSRRWLDEEGFLFALDGAYVLFTLLREQERMVMHVEDYAYVDGRSREELFRFIGSMDGQAEMVRMHLPPDEPVSLEHSSKYGKAGRWGFQARVVDLTAALAPLESAEEQAFSVRIRDDFCEWNDGVFEIETGPGGTAVRPGRGPAKADLPIQTLPLLVVGAISPRSAVVQGQASGDLKALSGLSSLCSGSVPFLPASDAF